MRAKLKLRQCAGCERLQLLGEDKFKRCAGCKSVSFCTSDCQVKHWKKHKLKCTRSVVWCSRLRAVIGSVWWWLELFLLGFLGGLGYCEYGLLGGTGFGALVALLLCRLLGRYRFVLLCYIVYLELGLLAVGLFGMGLLAVKKFGMLLFTSESVSLQVFLGVWLFLLAWFSEFGAAGDYC